MIKSAFKIKLKMKWINVEKLRFNMNDKSREKL